MFWFWYWLGLLFRLLTADQFDADEVVVATETSLEMLLPHLDRDFDAESSILMSSASGIHATVHRVRVNTAGWVRRLLGPL